MVLVVSFLPRFCVCSTWLRGSFCVCVSLMMGSLFCVCFCGSFTKRSYFCLFVCLFVFFFCVCGVLHNGDNVLHRFSSPFLLFSSVFLLSSDILSVVSVLFHCGCRLCFVFRLGLALFCVCVCSSFLCCSYSYSWPTCDIRMTFIVAVFLRHGFMIFNGVANVVVWSGFCFVLFFCLLVFLFFCFVFALSYSLIMLFRTSINVTGIFLLAWFVCRFLSLPIWCLPVCFFCQCV